MFSFLSISNSSLCNKIIPRQLLWSRDSSQYNYNFHLLLASRGGCYYWLIESETISATVVLLILNRLWILTCFQPYYDWKDSGNTSPIGKAFSLMNKTHLYSSFLGKAVRGLIVTAHWSKVHWSLQFQRRTTKKDLLLYRLKFPIVPRYLTLKLLCALQ